MSLVINTTTPEGIVIAADSRQSQIADNHIETVKEFQESVVTLQKNSLK